jgi:DNA-binding Lrp family transcriptional regulator
MINSTLLLTKNQYTSSANAVYKHQIEQFISLFQEKSQKELRIIHALRCLENVFDTVYASQSWIARKAGVARESVSRCVTRLEEQGVLVTVYRPNKTCLYKFAEIFQLIEVRNALVRFVRAFNYTKIKLLFQAFIPNVTRKIYVSNSSKQYQSINRVKKTTTNNTHTHSYARAHKKGDMLTLNWTIAGHEVRDCFDKSAIAYADKQPIPGDVTDHVKYYFGIVKKYYSKNITEIAYNGAQQSVSDLKLAPHVRYIDPIKPLVPMLLSDNTDKYKTESSKLPQWKGYDTKQHYESDKFDWSNMTFEERVALRRKLVAKGEYRSHKLTQ